MRNPDYGQYLWESGLADKPVIVVGAALQTVGEAPGASWDVSFHISHEDTRFCGTLNTRQPAETIRRLVASGRQLVVEGRLDRDTVTGQGGEEYRLILGRVALMAGNDVTPDAPTRQQRRAAERQARKRR